MVKIVRWLLLSLLGVICLLVLMLSAVRLFSDRLPDFRAEIENQLAQLTKHPVQIERQSIVWHGLEPVLHLENFSVLETDRKKELLRIKTFDIGVNVIMSLIKHHFVPGDLRFSGAQLSLNEGQNQRWNVNGIQELSPSALQAVALSIKGNDISIAINPYLQRNIFISSFDAKINWHKTIKGLKLEVYQSDLHTNIGHLSSTLSLRWEGNNPFINIFGRFYQINVKDIMPYMSDHFLSKTINDWLHQSVRQGKIKSGFFVVKGFLNRFPFDHHDGEFLVVTKWRDAVLHYQPKWPEITGIDGELRFKGKSLHANIHHAFIFGKPTIQQAFIDINDLDHSVLNISSHIHGDLADAVKFIHESPLQALMGSQWSFFQFKGPMQLGLKLSIPLWKDDLKIQYSGNIKTQDAIFSLPDYQLVFENLAGNFQFSDKHVYANRITGLFNHQPVIINMFTKPLKNDQFEINMTMSGLLSSKLLEQWNSSFVSKISGETPFHARFELHPKENKTPDRLSIESDLQGLNIDLPAPFKKSVDQRIPSQLELSFENPKRLHINFQYGSTIKGMMAFQKNSQNKMSFEGGQIHLGDPSSIIQNQQRGLSINGELDHFAWSDWKSLLTNGSSNSMRSYLNKIDLSIQHFEIFDRTFSQTELQLLPTQKGWKLSINNAQMNGSILIPDAYPKRALQANFQRFIWMPDETTSLSLLPSDIPPLKATVSNFRYRNKSLNSLELDIEPVNKNTIRIHQLAMGASTWSLKTEGWWKLQTNHQETHLQGTLRSHDLGAALKGWDITDNLSHTNGSVAFNLSWRDSPFHPQIDTLNGNLQLMLNHGRINNIGENASMKMGLGRVLTLLSLQSLPRRLTFDFSDLSGGGFSFDTLQGNFEIKNGDASTENAFLEGVVARVRISGRIGLAKKDYDIQLLVTPNVTSSLPIVATLTGGPIVGAVTWLVDTVVSHEVRKITTVRYHVTGSWEKPLVGQPLPL